MNGKNRGFFILYTVRRVQSSQHKPEKSLRIIIIINDLDDQFHKIYNHRKWLKYFFHS